MRRTIPWAWTAVVLAVAVAPALAGERWLHIRVEEGGNDPQTVRVNLPFSLLESVAPLIRDANIEKGKIRLGEEAFRAVDLHAILNAVRSAEEGEYVTVESAGETIRVTKSRDSLLIKVDKQKDEPGKVNIKVPLAVVEALVSGDPDELDFGAALKALKDEGDCELIAVHDAKSVVRIWVDGKNESR